MTSTPIYPQSQDNRLSKFSAKASLAFMGGIEGIHMPLPLANPGLQPPLGKTLLSLGRWKMHLDGCKSRTEKKVEFEISTTV
jgi:hypothetical protein